MSPFPAVRKNGICYGSLWKQHTSVAVPPNLGASSPGQSHSAGGGESLTSSVLESNERSKNHDYCVLVGNTLSSYGDLACFRRGDNPTSEVRIVGASAWNPNPMTGGGSSHGTSSSSPAAGTSVSVPSLASPSLSGATLASEAAEVIAKSPSPTSTVAANAAVAAAAAAPTGPPTFRIVTYAGTHIYCSAPTPADRDTWLAALHSGLEASYASYTETLSTISSSGSEGSCTAKKQILPLSLTATDQKLLTPAQPQRGMRLKNALKRRVSSRGGVSLDQISSSGYKPPYEIDAPPSSKFCISCGRFPPEPAMKYAATPLPQYGRESRCDLCQDCLISQGVLSHVNMLCGLYASDAHERAALTTARDLVIKTLETTVRESERERIRQQILARQQQQQQHHHAVSGEESGESDDTILSGDDKTTSTGESWTNVEHNDEVVEEQGDETQTSSTLSGSWMNVDQLANSGLLSASGDPNSWISLPPTAATTKALLNLIDTPSFQAYRRRSRVLDLNCRMLESGGIGCAAEFMENLDEMAREATAGTALDQSATNTEIGMKKEAFRVAGDMGAAIKLLHDYALPPDNKQGGVIGGSNGNTEMLGCILEFFLDLCDEGEMQSVAFFWPQLRSIHLRMLPPVDADALVRVELVEDFLLTVSTRYSVHLSLELVWSCIADLEESLVNPACSSGCRRRRFAVLRFVCELESLLFDFDGGWGGGSVSLRGMLAPSQHQAALIRDAVAILQLHRRFSSHHLTRSVRLEKLRREAALEEEAVMAASLGLLGDDSFESTDDEETKQPIAATHAQPAEEARVNEQLRIAKNADYFSSQLMFVRRLGDIAEKLRFTDVEKRAAALKTELEILNSSGRMGGDPLNKLLGEGEGLATVVQLPSKEGHVFRSKERTPVLLLMEMIREEGGSLTSSSNSGPDGDAVEPSASDDTPIATGSGVLDSDQVEEATSATPSPTEEGDNILKGALESNTVISGRKNEAEEKEIMQTLPLARTDATVGESEMNEIGLNAHRRADADIVQSATPSRDNLTVSVTSTSGANISLVIPPPPSPKPSVGKLKRFESPVNPSATGSVSAVTPENKVTMEDLISNMMQHQLHIPELPVLDEGGDDRQTEELHATAGGASHCPKIDEEVEESKGEKDEADGSSDRDEETSNSGGAIAEAVLSKHSTSSPGTSLVSRGRAQQQASLSVSQRKMSAFGSLSSSAGGSDAGDTSSSLKSKPPLAAYGDVRREVLTTIMVKGMRGKNIIASSAAPEAQRTVQAMDRRRAVELMMNGTAQRGGSSTEDTNDKTVEEGQGDQLTVETNRSDSSSFALRPDDDGNPEVGLASSPPTEEDEAVESLRLLLIQNRVARGDLSPENAARVLAPAHMNDTHSKKSGSTPDILDAEHEPVDAGDVDSRLAGCGTLSHTVLSAIRLWQEGRVSHGELLELVQKDTQFLRHSVLPGAANASKLSEDSAFWVRFSFGERWAEKKARIATSSMYGSTPGWDLTGVIVKSNDDLRQEAFVMQLIELCQEAFEMAGLELWVQPYRILATGRTTGIIEMVRNAMSFDSLKKRPGYGKGGLRGHLQRMTEFDADPADAFRCAQRNFVRSLAAYSLMSYLFWFKDRHNGNILLDTAGHVVHIDFGFVFGIAPGGSFSLEQAPFKLTEEMMEVMDGIQSPLFSEFVTLFCCGFLALQAHTDTFLTVVEITCKGSTFKCFDGKDSDEIVSKLRDRFCPNLNKESTVAYALDLIKQAMTSYGTKQYDYFQYLSQGIAS